MGSEMCIRDRTDVDGSEDVDLIDLADESTDLQSSDPNPPPSPVFHKPPGHPSSADSTERAVNAIRGSTLFYNSSDIVRHHFGMVEKKDTLAALEPLGPINRHTCEVPEMISRKPVPMIEIVSDGVIPFVVVSKRDGTHTSWMPPNYNLFTKVINRLTNKLLRQKHHVAMVVRKVKK